jgi:hypothetical protein
MQFLTRNSLAPSVSRSDFFSGAMAPQSLRLFTVFFNQIWYPREKPFYLNNHWPDFDNFFTKLTNIAF